jgi:transposase
MDDDQLLSDLLDAWNPELVRCYDTAVKSGMIHNRLRDWHDGNHPGYVLGAWLRDYKEQAVSGYWHSLATLARWCSIRSYLDTAAAHGVTALDAISSAIAGKPWLPPLPALG